VKQLKSGKAPGPDGIPPEALKIDPTTTADMLHPLFVKIRQAEKIPTKWKQGYLVKLPKKADLGLGAKLCFSRSPAGYSAALFSKDCWMPLTNNYDVTKQALGKTNPALTILLP